jgi:hypothetical protein
MSCLNVHLFAALPKPTPILGGTSKNPKNPSKTPKNRVFGVKNLFSRISRAKNDPPHVKTPQKPIFDPYLVGIYPPYIYRPD